MPLYNTDSRLIQADISQPTPYGFDLRPRSITLSTVLRAEDVRPTVVRPFYLLNHWASLEATVLGCLRANSTYYVKLLANHGEEKQQSMCNVQKVTNQRGSYKFDMAALAVAVLAVS
ncbi:uncharacterized protein ATNIH1004_002077 [Aspergillus tanneri]|uniref:Uncharacterized protein n=1 Tax=Aspergillus tanneri TaxID=1220188 RepID=A0A5M9M6S5_9EURO|nr:uncharacterized protein ATNIH1004_002077 [Aspergillus tanneri]KAA8641276.1 hypothetical protein ATNIH1004_002077 [Aspergillus tanneri]